MRALLCTLLLLLPATAQEPAIRLKGPTPGVVRLGETSLLEVVIEGDVVSERPVVSEIDGLAHEVLGPSRQEQSVFDGRHLQRSVLTTWTIALRPRREGRFTIPPLTIRAGGKVEITRTVAFECLKDPRGQELGFLVITPARKRVYVHEPIRLQIDYGIDATLAPVQGRANNGTPYFDIEIQAPWLDEPDGAVLLATRRDPQGEWRTLVANNHLQEARYETGHQRGARTFHRFWLEKAFLPTRIGTWQLAAPMLRFQVRSGENLRDRFGFFEPTRGENFYVYGQPTEVEVLPIPEQGRPTPYSGAVGRFSLAAGVAQTRVKVGASVRLTLTVRGQGNTEFLKLPELDNLPGLHLLGKTEQRAEEEVKATYDLRLTSAATQAIPPITWNFFDTTPGVERFASVSTEPIALEVVPLGPGEGLAPLPGTASRPVVPGKDDIFDIRSAVGGPGPVLAAPWPRALLLGLVLLPWVAALGLLFATARWRRARADVAGRRARAALGRCEEALRRGDAHAALVGYLADRLDVEPAAVLDPELGARLTARGCDAGLAHAAQTAVERGVAARYGGGGGVDVAGVRALVTQLERAAKWCARLLVLAVFTGTALPQAVPDPGVAAYRRGDYAQAEALFAQACAAPGADRRRHYDLGNACYRQGKLAAALLAYERARLALPRDPELLANLALVRSQLGLPGAEGESFGATLTSLRERLHPSELVWLTVAAQALAAGLLVFGWRRRLLRGCGLVAAALALGLALEVLVFAPARPPRGVVLVPEAALVAEPRAGREALATLRAGVTVEVLGFAERWGRVRVGEREGYLPADAFGRID